MAVHFHEASRPTLARKIQLVFIEMNGDDKVVYYCVRFYVIFRLTQRETKDYMAFSYVQECDYHHFVCRYSEFRYCI